MASEDSPEGSSSAAAAAAAAGFVGAESVKLFVGQVPRQMTEEQLIALFQEVALVDEVNIIRDKATRASRGCCFLICPSRDEADKAIEAYHNKRTLPGASNPLQVKYADGELERLEHKLFIGMLPKNVTEVEVSTLFSKFGSITDLQILRNSQQTAKAGCAFLKYETKDQALSAIEALNGKHRMEGSSVPMVVKWADTEKERHARKAQKIQSQVSPNSLQQPSFPPLPMGYLHSYGGFGYKPAGAFGLMPYHVASVQQQAAFQNAVGNSLRGVSPELSPSPAPRSFDPLQSGRFVSRPYPPVPGVQYPSPFPGGIMNQPFGNTLSTNSPNENLNLAMASSNSSSNSGRQIKGPPGANLFIYHIPQEFGDQELSAAFQGFGRVLSAKVFVDKATGVSKCFGFVSYDSAAAAQAAISMMNGIQLGGKKLKVQLKRDNDQTKLF